MQLELLEAAVLQKLLEGEHPVLVALRQQLPALSVTERDGTGVGFYTTFSIADAALAVPIVSGSSPFGDVEAEVDGLQHGAGFLLYIKGGLLHLLEGYSYGEEWPAHVDTFSLVYSSHDRTAVLATIGTLP